MASRQHALLFICGIAGICRGQAPEPFRISVNVDLIVLQAAVHDPNGGFASDLRERNFEVYEDGVRQSIRLFRHEDIPVTVGLVVDHSGSMRRKLADVSAAGRTFVQSSSPEDQMFVVNFNEKVRFGLPGATPFTARPEELVHAILNAPVAGMTALYDAFVTAHERLLAGSHDKKVLIVISDGGDNASLHSLAEVLTISERSGVLVYAIGIFDQDDEDRNPGVLKRLAKATGGEAFFPRRVSEVVSICERIARDIRNQYTLAYVSSNAVRPGVYHKIHVVARGSDNSKLVVRTRSGYIAAGEMASFKDATAVK